eukprot:TRINITY_DN21212_c0_g1_i1.p1 TRINITY_DN21212_c0_g1~~TRINITY_DN21212_c0_g1_i1.p1  ORF type:complete len:419 (+),score=86.24 TRINITY_DN21212_c0_g1_i1:83-1339(+)
MVGSTMLDELADVFAAFAGGPEMDGRSFVKCLRDAELLDERLTLIDVDLIFASCKPRGGRKINLPRFGRALGMVAARKNLSAAAVLAAVCVARAPIYDNNVTLPAGCESEIRKLASGGSQCPNAGSSNQPPVPVQPYVPPLGMVGSMRSTKSNGSDGIPAEFFEGASRVDKTASAPAGMQDRPLPTLLGSMRRTSEGRRAQQLYEETFRAVQSDPAPRPIRHSPREPNLRRGAERFYYDKSTYTGTHKFGGPSTSGTAVGNGGYSDLKTLVQRDRVQDDALHRKKRLSGQDHSPPPAVKPLAARRSLSNLQDAEEEMQGNITYSIPTPRRTGPERFYYDKSTYTGTHRNGGPQVTGSSVGKEGYNDLSTLVVRSHVQDDHLHRRNKPAGGGGGSMSRSLNALLSPRLEARQHTWAATY